MQTWVEPDGSTAATPWKLHDNAGEWANRSGGELVTFLTHRTGAFRVGEGGLGRFADRNEQLELCQVVGDDRSHEVLPGVGQQVDAVDCLKGQRFAAARPRDFLASAVRGGLQTPHGEIEFLPATLGEDERIGHLATDPIGNESASRDGVIAVAAFFLLQRGVAHAHVLQRPEGVDVEIGAPADVLKQRVVASLGTAATKAPRAHADGDDREPGPQAFGLKAIVGGRNVGGRGRNFRTSGERHRHELFDPIARVDELHDFDHAGRRRESARTDRD